jgi:hypothetical protein
MSHPEWEEEVCIQYKTGIEEGLEDFCIGYRKNFKKNVKRQERIEWEHIDIVIAR